MIYLAMDTSTSVLTVALGDEERIISEYSNNLKKDHAARLMPAIEYMMEEANLKMADLGAIVVAEGPGSYTGLRIGLSTAKTLAWARKLPLITVSSLAMIAASVKDFPGLIVPLIDARRGQVFTGLYHGDSDLKVVMEDRLVMLDAWLEEIIVYNKDKRPLIFTGTDLSLHQETIIASRLTEVGIGYQLADIASQPGRASELIVLAQERVRLAGLDDEISGARTPLANIHENPMDAVPNYLRIVEAEYRLLEEEKKSK